jgi:EAL domain-containing protein (putative c-di-GMP-specific phosphodiesterase class I)
MYRAKSSGPGQQLLLQPPVAEPPVLAKGPELTSALAKSELALYYQPVINLSTGRTTGVEALLRWEHPERGTIAPELFLPLAERNGLIHPLGRWVLQRACAAAAAFSGAADGLDIAVNVSPTQLTNPAIIGHVRDALRSSGLAPERLILEVTESVMLAEPQAAAIALEELARLRVRIALDDVGTGYNSLTHLRCLPISTLKIDKPFVAGIHTQPRDRAICQSLIALAAALGADCVAEGVETIAQRDALARLHCPHGQGFLWTPAVPLHQLNTRLKKTQELSARHAGR